MGQTAGGRITRTGADGTVTDVPFDTATSPFAAQLAAFSAAATGTAGWPWPLERDLRLHRLLHTAGSDSDTRMSAAWSDSDTRLSTAIERS
jgi:1,5-anhydro-D-fructose reductase (1,5-anhydro-D-mannitol-forming)